MNSPGMESTSNRPVGGGAEHDSLASPAQAGSASQSDTLDDAADDQLAGSEVTKDGGQVLAASPIAQALPPTANAPTPQPNNSAASSSTTADGGNTEKELESLVQLGDGNVTDSLVASVESDMAVVGAFSAGQEQNHTLEALRSKIIETRGARAQLPAGWEEDALMPVAPDSSDDSQDQATNPLDSDSDTGSESSSSNDSSDDDQERIAMVSDYDSDESSPAKKGSGDAPRGPMTKSELPPSRAAEMFGKLPFNEIPEDSRCDLKPLGKVHGNVQEVLVIAQAEEIQRGNGNTPMSRFPPGVRIIGGASNERQGPILDAGSLVCTPEGKVIGFIFETFGSLLAPLYSVLLPTAANAACYKVGQDVFFLPSHSTVLRPAELRASQGKASDASNVNDEEAGVEEMEFSDDEEEAEYKRRLKTSKKRYNARGPGGDVDEASTDVASRGGKGSGRGVDRGRGRGRGGARGRGDRGANFGSTQTGGSLASFPLPQRPNWQLDDPGSASATNLSYDEPSGSTSVGGRSKPSPYEAGVFTPPKSAGLPAVPREAAELAERNPSEAPFVVSSTRAVHQLPPMPLPAPPAPATHAPVSSGMNDATGPSPTLPPSRSHQTDSSSVAAPGSPAFATGPPPGAHINPLFAHQWAPVQQQQPQHIAPSSHSTAGQQPYYPPEQQFGQQGWNAYHYNSQGGQVGGYPYPQYQQYAPYGGQQAQQTPYWSPQQQASQQYASPIPHSQHRSPYANSSGQTQIPSQHAQFWPHQQYQGAQYPPDGARGQGDGSYDPSQGKMDFSK